MSKDYIGKTCPYCKTPLVEGDTVVFCSVCDMPHHLTCWQDNQGCTTFGCTGFIKEIIGKDDATALASDAAQPTPDPVTATPSEQSTLNLPTPAPAEQTEKQIETLYASKEMVFMVDLPLVLEETAIIIDRTKDKLFARCTFRSIADKAIKAVLTEISCQDVWGSTLGEPIAFQYLDLNTKRESKFGQSSLVELVDKTTRKIKVTVKKIMYADDTVISGSDATFTMAAPILLSQQLGSEELAVEYARETTQSAKFVLKEIDGYWFCTCGSLNETSEEKCHLCGCSKEQLTAALNPDALQTNMINFAAQKKAAAEKAQAEQAERVRQAEEQVRLEQERKDREIKLAESKERAQKRRKKTLKAIIISLIVVVVVSCTTICFGIPYFHYRVACNALDNGEYDTARKTFLELGDFLDSEELADLSLYEKGKAALKNKEYDTAIRIFKTLGDYKDSEDLILEAKYLKAEKYQSDGKYKEAYRLFVGLESYKESQDEALATMLLWQAEALGSSTTNEASEFSETVKLNSDQYELFYSTILLYLYAHENADYWCNWGTTVASENVLTMLKMLPSTYQDTATLLKLFSVLTVDWEGYDDLFRKDEALMRQCWSLAFVQDLVKEDRAITYFLEGYWTGSGYYLNFYEDEDDGETTYSNFDLPWVSKPYGTKYYDIEDMIYYWDNEDGEHLTKVFRFEIIDYDTIKVYCYKNNRTYTLYR